MNEIRTHETRTRTHETRTHFYDHDAGGYFTLCGLLIEADRKVTTNRHRVDCGNCARLLARRCDLGPGAIVGLSALGIAVIAMLAWLFGG